MNATQDKVKDIIEVRPYINLRDYAEDPKQTVGGYLFTDTTSDLMAKWLDKVAEASRSNGIALALAGHRGVGKSHFLAVLSALITLPEIRSKISDPHVASSAQTLMRRHCPVISVRRGSGANLTEEVRDAVCKALEQEAARSSESIDDILTLAREAVGDLPLMIIVDTDADRSNRVARDDGPDLERIAQFCSNIPAFVAVALDDDIAGADGTNAGIARTFAIDYLDDEHLLKVVNSYIFPKYHAKQSALVDIYSYFRTVLPDFRWSEHRFSSLYPLHPSILEIAPFVRLYLHEFALLGFASEAGQRILGRPANSLIALDEVFDNAEHSLRNKKELANAFEQFDLINSTSIAKIPVINRLQAKLVLKALFLLSLNGNGATARNICASVLIFDEAEPEKAVANVAAILESFVSDLPDSVGVRGQEGQEAVYRLKGFVGESTDDLLSRAAAEVSDDEIPRILSRMMLDRFSDVSVDGSKGSEPLRIECSIEWRGGLRRGQVVLDPTIKINSSLGRSSEEFDWEVIIDFSDSGEFPEPGIGAPIIWKPAALSAEEVDSFKKLFVLNGNEEVRGHYGNELGSLVQTYSVLARKAFLRSMLDDAKLVIDRFDFNFSDEARVSQALSGVFASMLEPLFETRFPSHPYFRRRFTKKVLSETISQFYDPGKQRLESAQELAGDFAQPLGLTRDADGVLLPAEVEELKANQLTRPIFEVLEGESDGIIEIAAVTAKLSEAPIGLVKEAHQLLLAALAAARKIELVTTGGDTINYRSLVLDIAWDNIVGIAVPREATLSSEKLDRWAELLIGSGPADAGAKDERTLVEAMGEWLEAWDKSRLMQRFEDIPSEYLSLNVWFSAERLARTYSLVAEAIRECMGGAVDERTVLARIAGVFNDSTTGFESAREDQERLTEFLDGFEIRQKIKTYLSLSEASDDDAVEAARDVLTSRMASYEAAPSADLRREISYAWDKFVKAYSERYLELHDKTMRSERLRERIAEVLEGDEWWTFQNLAQLSLIDRNYWVEAQQVLRVLRGIGCGVNAKEALERTPGCVCSFTLSSAGYLDTSPEIFLGVLLSGLESFTQRLKMRSAEISSILREFAKASEDSAAAEAALGLVDRIEAGIDPLTLSELDLKLFTDVCGGDFAVDSEVARAAERDLASNAIDSAIRELERVSA
jgi:hypothetical protein